MTKAHAFLLGIATGLSFAALLQFALWIVDQIAELKEAIQYLAMVMQR